MMHTCLKKAVSVKSAPKSDRGKPGSIAQPFHRKIDRGLLRHEIDVREHSNSSIEMLKDLSAPSGLRTSVIAFPFFESELKEKLNQIDKKATRRPKGMVVMVGPAKSK